MAALHASGELPLDPDFRRQGNLGTIFSGRLDEKARVADRRAVMPTILGRSWIYGFNTLVPDAEDPLSNGYAMDDIRA